MAGELFAATGRVGRTCYFLIRDRTSQFWNGSSFETYAAANYATYDIAATEVGTNRGFYKGTFPSDIAAGVYDILMCEQQGGSPAETDPIVAQQDGYQWNGTVTMPLSDLTTSGQLSTALPIQMTRGVMKSHFHVHLVSQSDHITPFISGVLSGQILRDNGSYGPLQSGAFTEKGNGTYRFPLTSGDLDGEQVSLFITARGISGGQSDPWKATFVMQRRSGS